MYIGKRILTFHGCGFQCFVYVCLYLWKWFFYLSARECFMIVLHMCVHMWLFMYVYTCDCYCSCYMYVRVPTMWLLHTCCMYVYLQCDCYMLHVRVPTMCLLHVCVCVHMCHVWEMAKFVWRDSTSLFAFSVQWLAQSLAAIHITQSELNMRSKSAFS
jgi:hypothetical protein